MEELLSQARELALKIQDEAVKDQDFDITRTDEFITRFQESKTSLKRSAPLGSAKRLREMAAEMAEDADEAAGADGGRGSGGGQVVKPPPAKKVRGSFGSDQWWCVGLNQGWTTSGFYPNSGFVILYMALKLHFPQQL